MVFRVNKSNNYTVLSNYHFKDKRLSLKAKGLLSLMLSLSDDWDYSISGLSKLSSDGETAVRSALTELEKFNYLKRSRVYENGKIIDWEYNIYEQPVDVDNLDVENQQLEKQLLENKDNKVINKLNTKEKKDKILKNKDTKQKPEKDGFLKHSKQSEFKIDGLVDMYNSICIKLPKVRALTDKRKTSVEKLYKKYDLDTFKKVFEIANTSSFLTGDNDRGWKADFDWLLQEEKFIRVLEGKYDSKRKKQDKFADEGLATCLTRKEPRKEIDKNVKRKTY